MPPHLHLNHQTIGFADHPTEGTIFSPGALTNEVRICKGKLRLRIVTPSFRLTPDLHNNMLPADYGTPFIEQLRFVLYEDWALPEGRYGAVLECPQKATNMRGFEVYGFPEYVQFHGTIRVDEGVVHIEGELRLTAMESDRAMPVSIVQHFEAAPLLPPRRAYTWQEALQADPLEVYDLRIGKGTFRTFPTELLAFHNLEQLWIGGQARWEVSALPSAFYGLRQLHTVQLYQTQLKELDEAIGQLDRLEELVVNSGRLRQLPQGLVQLDQLEVLELKYNQLERLPEGLTDLPKLRILNLEGNRWTHLPKGLIDIPQVQVDRRYRKLYKDDSYPSENPDPIEEDLFGLSHFPKGQATLHQLLQETALPPSHRDFLRDVSLHSLYLIPEEAGQEVPLGQSKVGGAPDLPVDWEHPTNANGNFYLFHAQLNCEDLAPYQPYLPRTGMLYFFVNDEEYAAQPKVLYNPQRTPLKRWVYAEEAHFSDSDFDDSDYRYKAIGLTPKQGVSLPELYNAVNHGTDRHPKYAALFDIAKDDDAAYDALELLSDVANELSDRIHEPLGIPYSNHRLRAHAINSYVFTQHESPQERAAARFGGEPSEWMVLLNLESLDQFCFWDAGTLTYCMHKKDLAIQDFFTIYASIESS